MGIERFESVATAREKEHEKLPSVIIKMNKKLPHCSDMSKKSILRLLLKLNHRSLFLQFFHVISLQK